MTVSLTNDEFMSVWAAIDLRLGMLMDNLSKSVARGDKESAERLDVQIADLRAAMHKLAAAKEA